MQYKHTIYRYRKTKQGFTLVELVVGVAVLTIVIVAIYNAYTGIFGVVSKSRSKIEAVNLANEQFEIVRNLPYADVGIDGGIPDGVLVRDQTLVRSGNTYTVLTTVRNVDEPFDGTLGGTPNDLSPADGKLVEVEINCTSCKDFVPIILSTKVSPKNLETASTNGALFIKVFDGNGNPIPDASVRVENKAIVPNIVINDTTNSSGMLQIVDAPPGNTAYEITVTKSGYSTDRTYSATVSNPNPTKPHATVVVQQVTQISFVIDRLSSIDVTSVSETCTPVGNLDFSLIGAKTVGTLPVVHKYNQNLITNSGGALALSNMEWDSYSFANIDASYDLIGFSPISPFNLAPNSNQNLQLVVSSPKNPNILVVSVLDSNNVPIADATVELFKTGFSQSKQTGKGSVTQTSWSGGSGVATTTTFTDYFSSDGNVDPTSVPGVLTLKQIFGEYMTSGVLTSASIDMGTASNLSQIVWNPTDQPVSAGAPNVRFQIASNNDGGAFQYTGPDGTNATYYDSTNRDIHSSHDNKRFLRYAAYLNTATTTTTPTISDVSFVFTSACTPPGQVHFSGLSYGNYTIRVSKVGYVTQDVPVTMGAQWQMSAVTLLPE